MEKGIYQHYKGKLYQVIGFSVSATNGKEGEASVLYKAIEEKNNHDHFWAREISEFLEEVHNPKYPAEKDALYKVPRFKFLKDWQ